jgi:cytochrome c oxidase subunit IV
MTDHAHHSDHEHHGGNGIYIVVFFALCGLTTLSFLTYFDFWREHVPSEISRAFMMAVSCTKAMLVIMFFMHLKWEANWKWVLTVPASIMSALLIFALVPDIGLRMRHASYDRLRYAAEEPALSDKVEDEPELTEGMMDDGRPPATAEPAG